VTYALDHHVLATYRQCVVKGVRLNGDRKRGRVVGGVRREVQQASAAVG